MLRLILPFLAMVAIFSCGSSVTGTKINIPSSDTSIQKVIKSDAEWRKQLSPEAYRVLRAHGTERPNTSPLNMNKKKGDYLCAGCDFLLYTSKDKYDSGTGWPSFFRPANDYCLGTSEEPDGRTEIHCARCEGHLGHVFNDGPRPTGMRYCMNGVALKFVEKK